MGSILGTTAASDDETDSGNNTTQRSRNSHLLRSGLLSNGPRELHLLKLGNEDRQRQEAARRLRAARSQTAVAHNGPTAAALHSAATASSLSAPGDSEREPAPTSPSQPPVLQN